MSMDKSRFIFLIWEWLWIIGKHSASAQIFGCLSAMVSETVQPNLEFLQQVLAKMPGLGLMLRIDDEQRFIPITFMCIGSIIVNVND